MDNKTFIKIFEDQFATSDTMLNETKRKEYAAGGDVLHNFRKGARLQGETAREALGGVLSKQIVSIFDMIKEDEARPLPVWEEKINDSINYLILLKAIIIEDEQKAEAAKQGIRESIAIRSTTPPPTPASVHPIAKAPGTSQTQATTQEPEKDK